MPDIIMTCLENGNVGDIFQFPSLPERIKVNGQPYIQTYKIIGKGEVKFPKGNEVDTISWDGYFFNQDYVTNALYQNLVPPVQCVQVLDWARKNKTKWRVLCTDYGIDKDMFVSKFDWEAYGGYGNIQYSIELSECVNLEVKKLSGTEQVSTQAQKTKKGRSSKVKSSSCTVKSGDTLSSIARKMTGSSKNWKKIYDLNKSAIEAAAKKYGKKSSDGGGLIYPGTKLNMPKS